jgi:hypothetical protein
MTTGAPFKVYAPDGLTWSHPRLAPWSTYLRCLGWWGWLPYKGVRQCTSVYPAPRCTCGQFALIWREQDDASTDKD